MANLSTVIEQLKAERERVHKQAQRIDTALAALASITTNGTRAPHIVCRSSAEDQHRAESALGEEESAEAEARRVGSHKEKAGGSTAGSVGKGEAR